MMLERIEQVIDLVAKSKDDKTTKTMTITAVIAFGVAVGAVAIYEHLANKLELTHTQNSQRFSEREYDDDDY